MNCAGIICELNPFHLGHARLLRLARERLGEEGGLVCLMSGDYVQRGAPAIVDRMARAEAAVLCGADLVLEMPVQVSLQSAEGFAAGGAAILSSFGAKALCFGAETANQEKLWSMAALLGSDAFWDALREQMKKGNSFPAARALAVEALGGDRSLLQRPNDILAVEYAKAAEKYGLALWPVRRNGDYHGMTPDPENPSATAVRSCMERGECWECYVPGKAAEAQRKLTVHTLQAGERAMLARLWSMTSADFEALPYGGEGLWRRLARACRESGSLDEILTRTKTRRYTRTRLERMLMCAFLGLTAQDLVSLPSFVRILAMNRRGKALLREAHSESKLRLIHAGERLHEPEWERQSRWADLYGLFAAGAPDRPGRLLRERVFILPPKSGST